MSLPTRAIATAKRGDLVCVESKHVAVFLEGPPEVTYSVTCGTVWNVTRDGIAKTMRTRDGRIIKLDAIHGYLGQYVTSAARIDVPKALEAAHGKETIEAVREAVRPFLKTMQAPAAKALARTDTLSRDDITIAGRR